jgi:hypothetical protein
MTPFDFIATVESKRISLNAIGLFWCASVDYEDKRRIKIHSAVGASPVEAVAKLLDQLEPTPFEDEPQFESEPWEMPDDAPPEDFEWLTMEMTP